MENVMATLQKRGGGCWLALATIPGLFLSGLLVSSVAAQAQQQNHVNQPTSPPGQSGMKPNTEMDTRHGKAEGRANKQTGADEDSAVPMSQQKGNQPKAPVIH
jgi:hypothetical protein